MRRVRAIAAAAGAFGLAAGAACSPSPATAPGGAGCAPPKTPTITFAAYSTPREVYRKIIPAFAAKWRAGHDGRNVVFQESYGGSTTQAQNVVNGFKADVVALSLAPDVEIIRNAGLITSDWTASNGGMVSASVVVFDVRPGNPRQIRDFDDLAKPGVKVLTPDPGSSGGARWNVVAAYGAALRGHAGNAKDDAAGVGALLERVFRNVTVLDHSARDSIKNFESGNGDVAITYENEVFTAQKAGLPARLVIPPSTVLIENPVAVVDRNAEEHCVADVAKAFVEYLHTADAQKIYGDIGYLRPADPAAAAKGGGRFATITDLFTVGDLGGWDRLDTTVFGDQGVFTKAFAKAKG